MYQVGATSILLGLKGSVPLTTTVFRIQCFMYPFSGCSPRFPLRNGRTLRTSHGGGARLEGLDFRRSSRSLECTRAWVGGGSPVKLASCGNKVIIVGFAYNR